MHFLEKWLLPPICVLTGKPAEHFDLSSRLVDALSRPDAVCPVCCELSLNVGGEKIYAVFV